jgi:hypothetical protein
MDSLIIDLQGHFQDQTNSLNQLLNYENITKNTIGVVSTDYNPIKQAGYLENGALDDKEGMFKILTLVKEETQAVGRINVNLMDEFILRVYKYSDRAENLLRDLRTKEVAILEDSAYLHSDYKRIEKKYSVAMEKFASEKGSLVGKVEELEKFCSLEKQENKLNSVNYQHSLSDLKDENEVITSSLENQIEGHKGSISKSESRIDELTAIVKEQNVHLG